MGFVAASGALLTSWLFHIKPTIVDAILASTIVGSATMALIYYLDFSTLVLSDGRHVSELISFADYVDLVMTKAHMRIGRSGADTGEVGDAGYLFAILRLGGFVLGSFCAFAVLYNLPSCEKCQAYLKKIFSRSTKDLTAKEAAVLHENFKTGDLPIIRQVLEWQPPERKLPKDDVKARLTFRLLSCPKCAERRLIASVQVAKNGEWKDAKGLAVTRMLEADVKI